MIEKSFEHTLKGTVEAAERFGKVKADHEKWMEINKMTVEDRPTLIYYVQTLYYTFKRDQEVEYSRDRQYAIELLEKAMECQHDIWNAAIEDAALIVQPKPHVDEERRCEDIAEQIRKLKK